MVGITFTKYHGNALHKVFSKKDIPTLYTIESFYL